MGGDYSQKLVSWRGTYSFPGHSKPPAHCKINTLIQRPSVPGVFQRRATATIGEARKVGLYCGVRQE
jgi:hypothetical protein